MRCFKCNQVHVENVKNFMIGNVIFCPHCHKSTVVRDNLNYHIRTLLKDAYEHGKKSKPNSPDDATVSARNSSHTAPRTRPPSSSISSAGLNKSGQQLNAIGENYDAPGKPFKKGSRFGWA